MSSVVSSTWKMLRHARCPWSHVIVVLGRLSATRNLAEELVSTGKVMHAKRHDM